MDLSNYSGPRVIINPQVMKDDRDALCVAFNESFRIIQEINGFDPVAEPTEKQRAFFRDTAYNDDERMLRRTILSRICTFDTSVSDPTDEQLQEAVEFLDTVMEIGAPQNEWEQRSVQRIRDAIARAVGQPRAPEEPPEPPAEGPSNAAAGGGETEDEEDLFGQNGTVEITDADAAEFADSATAQPDNFGKNGTVEITDADAAEFAGAGNGGVADDGTTEMGNNVKEFVASAYGDDERLGAGANPSSSDRNTLGTKSTVKVAGGRVLTEREAQFAAQRQASTESWKQRTQVPEQSLASAGQKTSGSSKFVQYGKRGNVYEIDGRRVTQREYARRKAALGYA